MEFATDVATVGFMPVTCERVLNDLGVDADVDGPRLKLGKGVPRGFLRGGGPTGGGGGCIYVRE